VQAGKSFTGFTKLCKGLAIILFLAHILVRLFPSAASYLALIPARYPLNS
jgi:flagellar biogenesis protein FliO